MLELEDIKESELSSNPVIRQMRLFNHEQVVFCNDRDTGLRAIIAIHNTVLGPSLGGTRMWQYESEMDALNDVLRLSRGMTYKAAISGLNLGGGKAVIMGDSRKDKSEALFRRFGKFVDSLGGKYITAEDVGISPKDMEFVAMETKHVAGLPERMGGGGDPSPLTAYGVYMAMKAASKRQFGTESLEGKIVVVQGVGHVGKVLVEYLVKENARVLVSDIHEETLSDVCKTYSVEAVAPEDVYTTQMDIYSPCGLGATVNDTTLKQLTCSIIAGAANNQLEKEEVHGNQVLEQGIIYCPDFLINAGGLINCYSEVIGYNRETAMAQTQDIYTTTLEIIDKSQKENIPTYLAANRLAEERIEAIGKVKLA